MKAIYGAIILIIVGSAALFFFGSKKPVQKAAEAACSASDPKVTVKVTADGFSPADITIKRCETIAWVSSDTNEHWVASDLHPTHTIYPEFDPKQPVPAGETWSFTFAKAGTWKCHDHLFPLNRCTIKVTD